MNENNDLYKDNGFSYGEGYHHFRITGVSSIDKRSRFEKFRDKFLMTIKYKWLYTKWAISEYFNPTPKYVDDLYVRCQFCETALDIYTLDGKYIIDECSGCGAYGQDE